MNILLPEDFQSHENYAQFTDPWCVFVWREEQDKTVFMTQHVTTWNITSCVVYQMFIVVHIYLWG